MKEVGNALCPHQFLSLVVSVRSWSVPCALLCLHSEGGVWRYCPALAWWDRVQHIVCELLCHFYLRVMTLDLLIEFTHNLPGHFKDRETEKE